MGLTSRLHEHLAQSRDLGAKFQGVKGPLGLESLKSIRKIACWRVDRPSILHNEGILKFHRLPDMHYLAAGLTGAQN